jgi:hypothetical protein
VHYYAAGYYYAAKGKGLLDKSNDNPLDAFANSVTKSRARTASAAPGDYFGPGSPNFR